MKFMYEKTCCESYKLNCNQGRACPHRKYTIQTETPKNWLNLRDGVCAIGLCLLSAVIAMLLVYFVVLATGLYKI